MGDTTKVDDQEKICRKILPANAVVAPHHVFKDNSKSAWRRDRRRPAWEAMLATIEQGELDVLIVYHGDRLVRQPRDLEDLLDISQSRGIRLLSPTGQYNLDDIDHQMMLRWIAARAKNEIDHLSRRLKDGHRRRRERGLVRSGGRGGRAYGFEPDNLTLKRDEVALIRECASRLLAGEGAGEIGRDWDARGLTTVTGTGWGHGTIKKMMMRPRLAGLMPDGESRAAWAPVLDDDVDKAREKWEAVCAILEGRAAAFSYTTNARTHLLSNIAVCGSCGQPVGIRHHSKGKQLIGYGCISKGCYKAHRAQVYLDGYVIGHVLELLNDPGFMKEIGRPDDPGLAAEISTLQARKAEVEGQLKALVDHPNLKPDLLLSALAGFDERIKEKQAKIALSARRRLLLEHAGLAEEEWDGLALSTRRALIQASYRIVIWPVSKKGPGFDPSTIDLIPVSDEDPEGET
jgi:site-specific DNA recombinase